VDTRGATARTHAVAGASDGRLILEPRGGRWLLADARDGAPMSEVEPRRDTERARLIRHVGDACARARHQGRRRTGQRATLRRVRGISVPGGCRPDRPPVDAGADGSERRARSRCAEAGGPARGAAAARSATPSPAKGLWLCEAGAGLSSHWHRVGARHCSPATAPPSPLVALTNPR
jgi:hypothetical protein